MYRDTGVTCPRCNLGLQGRRRRDIWRCAQCGGVHLAAAELEHLLRLVALDMGADFTDKVLAAARSEATPSEETSLLCPTCKRRLRRLVLSGIPALRCSASGELWFDGEDLGRLFEAVDETQRAQRSWVERLFERLFM